MDRRAMLNTAALVDLKAELIRKQDLLKKERLQSKPESQTNKQLKLKHESVKPNISRKILGKNPDETRKLLELQEEEDRELRRSREMLEQKARLYDKISKGETLPTEEESEMYMVDFHKKGVDKSNVNTEREVPTKSNYFKYEDTPSDLPIPDAEWVDYVDQSGNRKTCLREDLPFYQNSNRLSEHSDIIEEPKEPEITGPIHYQNVRNKEVRSHGVGYFAFSENEDDRKIQMEMLNTMRQQTMKQRDLKEKAKEKRAALLKARLDKVRQRRNIEKDEEEDKDSSEDEQVLSEIPLPGEVTVDEKPTEEMDLPTPFRMRPWDKGKDFSEVDVRQFVIPKRKDSTQCYLNQRREERLGDFAPPEVYSNKKRKGAPHYPGFKSSGQWQPDSSNSDDLIGPEPSSSHENSTNDFSRSENPINLHDKLESDDSVGSNVNIDDLVAKQLRMLRNNFFKE